MRIFIIAAFLSAAFTLQAQHNKPVDTSGKVYGIDTSYVDSLNQTIKKQMDAMKDESMTRMNENSYKYFTELSQENNRKARQGMWLRIALGIGFAVIGIIGFTRKKKAATGDKTKV